MLAIVIATIRATGDRSDERRGPALHGFEVLRAGEESCLPRIMTAFR